MLLFLSMRRTTFQHLHTALRRMSCWWGLQRRWMTKDGDTKGLHLPGKRRYSMLMPSTIAPELAQAISVGIGSLFWKHTIFWTCREAEQQGTSVLGSKTYWNLAALKKCINPIHHGKFFHFLGDKVVNNKKYFGRRWMKAPQTRKHYYTVRVHVAITFFQMRCYIFLDWRAQRVSARYGAHYYFDEQEIIRKHVLGIEGRYTGYKKRCIPNWKFLNRFVN